MVSPYIAFGSGFQKKRGDMTMDKVLYVLSGGFASGYRTYVLCVAAIVTVVANWAVGDQGTKEAVDAIWQMLLSASVATARAAMKD